MNNIKLTCLIVMMIFFLTACQSNPENEIVVNKNDSQLEDTINTDYTGEQEHISLQKNDEFKVVTGDLNIIVDANVETNYDKLPVVKVKPHEITQDEIKKWDSIILSGSKLYDPTGNVTKSDIENQILYYKNMLSDRDAMISNYGAESVDIIAAEFEAAVKRLENAYPDAPELAYQKESDYQFHSGGYYYSAEIEVLSTDKISKNSSFEAVTDNENGDVWTIQATNRDETDYSLHFLCCYQNDHEGNKSVPDFSENAAKELAKQQKDALGFSDWSLEWFEEENDSDRLFYSFHYSHKYEDVPAFSGLQIDLQSDDLYASNLAYEDLRIDIENGNIVSVWLTSPMDVIEVENENVKPLSFEEIYNKFKEYMQLQYSKNTVCEELGYDGNMYGDDSIFSIKIDKISQGLCRIKEKNSNTEYRMVPAWKFDGITMIDDNWEEKKTYLIINAIDGSVINYTLGY